MKKIVWRTDGRVFKPGDTMSSAGDHTATLDGAHAEPERILREAMADGADVRAASLYTWEDETWARRAWSYENGKYLYKLEIDEADVRHRGDVNHYTDIGDALKINADTSLSVQDYLSGRNSDRSKYPTARFEILVRKALVLERFDVCEPAA
jgi:hypothetical protein